jgi:hypothetical protein
MTLTDRPRCSHETHERAKSGSESDWLATVSRPRPWAEFGLAVGECAHCGTTLSRVVDEAVYLAVCGDDPAWDLRGSRDWVEPATEVQP